MVIKTIVDSLDTVPESLRGEYLEREGRYWLQAEACAFRRGDGKEGLYSVEDISGLKSTAQSATSKCNAAEKRLKEFGDLDPIDAQAAMSKVRDFDSGQDRSVQDQIDQATAHLRDRHTAEKRKTTERETELQSQLCRLLIGSEASEAIGKHGGMPSLLLPVIKDRTRVVEEDGRFVARVIDSDGQIALSRTGTDPMRIDELVASLKNEKDFGPAFTGTGAQGTGHRNGSRGSVVAMDVDTTKLSGAESLRRARALANG